MSRNLKLSGRFDVDGPQAPSTPSLIGGNAKDMVMVESLSPEKNL